VYVRVHVRVRVDVHVHVYARVHVHVRVAHVHVGIILRHQSRRVSSAASTMRAESVYTYAYACAPRIACSVYVV